MTGNIDKRVYDTPDIRDGRTLVCTSTEVFRISQLPSGRTSPGALIPPAGRKASQTASRRYRRPFFHGLILAIAIVAAFYAAFLPSRSATRAGGLTYAVDGLTYSGAVSGQVQAGDATVKLTSQRLPQPQTAIGPDGLEPNMFESAGLAAPPATALDTRIMATSAGSPTAGLPPCDTSQSILYCVYTIQPGDNLSNIASAFGLKNGEVEASDLLVHSNKPDIVSKDDLLQIGQKIRVPTQSAVLHTVRSGETASTIATLYDVELDKIALLPQNGVTDLNALRIGQELLVPDPQRFARPVVASASSSGPSAGPSSSGSTAIVRGGQASRSGFIWPATGPISSYFTGGHPLGIDIDFFGNPNQPVGSVAAGRVVFAGGNSCCSYGLYVVVDHGNGFETLYAHFSSIAVSVGQQVAQGQILGNGGRTGYATGNHLHFEVHLNGSVVNPLLYLP